MLMFKKVSGDVHIAVILLALEYNRPILMCDYVV